MVVFDSEVSDKKIYQLFTLTLGCSENSGRWVGMQEKNFKENCACYLVTPVRCLKDVFMAIAFGLNMGEDLDPAETLQTNHMCHVRSEGFWLVLIFHIVFNSYA